MKKRFIHVLVFVALTLLVILSGAIKITVVDAQEPTAFEIFLCRSVSVDQSEDGWLAVTCYKDEQPPAEPTATATIVPTEPVETPIVTDGPRPPTPTEPPAPTEPPVVTEQPPVPGEPFAGAPLCADHDDREYHDLWNAEVGCHYDHEHGDNPHAVDDVFGTEIYGIMDGEISYPWETSHENMNKHTSYKWFVREEDECFSRYTGGCITAFRALAHMDGHNVVSDYHSYVVEARVCREDNPDDCGTVRIGGWQFVGDLHIDRVVVYDRDERTLAPRAPRPVFLYNDQAGNSQFASWYPVSPMGWVRVATEFGDLWGHFGAVSEPVSSPNDLTFVPHCFDPDTGEVEPGCELNNSRRKPEIIGITVGPAQLRMLDLPLETTNVTWSGYFDRYGNVVEGCTEVGVDCIPVELDNVPVGVSDGYQYNGDYREHDIYFDGEPSGWIEYPN